MLLLQAQLLILFSSTGSDTNCINATLTGAERSGRRCATATANRPHSTVPGMINNAAAVSLLHISGVTNCITPTPTRLHFVQLPQVKQQKQCHCHCLEPSLSTLSVPDTPHCCCCCGHSSCCCCCCQSSSSTGSDTNCMTPTLDESSAACSTGGRQSTAHRQAAHV
jgi:hypothetical protein